MDIKQPRHRVGQLDIKAWRLTVAANIPPSRWSAYRDVYRVDRKIIAAKEDGSMAAVHLTAADQIAWLSQPLAIAFRRAARAIEHRATRPTASEP